MGALKVRPTLLKDLDTDDIEGCEFSKKIWNETSGDMEKLMVCVGH